MTPCRSINEASLYVPQKGKPSVCFLLAFYSHELPLHVMQLSASDSYIYSHMSSVSSIHIIHIIYLPTVILHRSISQCISSIVTAHLPQDPLTHKCCHPAATALLHNIHHGGALLANSGERGYQFGSGTARETFAQI